jgi:hydroxymethylbilane synthase
VPVLLLSMIDRPIILATRGSPLALAQTQLVLAECRTRFPDTLFDFRVFKTTGDRLQHAGPTAQVGPVPKGLFTKELEVALLAREADLAVHSLKDLPVELPAGLELAAVLPREDPRDVLILTAAGRLASSLRACGTLPAGEVAEHTGTPPTLATLSHLPRAVLVATSSTRRREQLLAAAPGLRLREIRGNVSTRLRRLRESPDTEATLLAAAGLNRLGYRILPDGRLLSPSADAGSVGFLACYLAPEIMLPCPGQAAIGLELRADDVQAATIARQLNDLETFNCVVAERTFLRGMGGGCQSPLAALAECRASQIRLRALALRQGRLRRAEAEGPPEAAADLGLQLSRVLSAGV